MQKDELIQKIMTYINCDQQTVELYLLLLEKPRSKAEIEGYDVTIQFLQDRCLINLYEDARSGGEELYFAIDPKYALSAILLNEAWNVDSNIHSLDDLEKRVDLEELHRKYLLYSEIAEEVQIIYKKQLPYIKEMAVVMQGPKKVASFIAEQLSCAQATIVAMVSPPQLMGEVVWQAIRDKMSGGCVYNRITEFDEIIRHGFEISCNEIQSYKEKLFIYTEGTLLEQFYVIDGLQVIFFERSKNRKKFLKKVHCIKNAGVANNFLKKYNKILEQCIDFESLIGSIKKYRKDYIGRARALGLSPLIIDWLKDIFNNGVFYSKANYDNDFVAKAISESLIHGLIKLLSDGSVVVNYGLQDVYTQ